MAATSAQHCPPNERLEELVAVLGRDPIIELLRSDVRNRQFVGGEAQLSVERVACDPLEFLDRLQSEPVEEWASDPASRRPNSRHVGSTKRSASTGRLPGLEASARSRRSSTYRSGRSGACSPPCGSRRDQAPVQRAYRFGSCERDVDELVIGQVAERSAAPGKAEALVVDRQLAGRVGVTQLRVFPRLPSHPLRRGAAALSWSPVRARRESSPTTSHSAPSATTRRGSVNEARCGFRKRRVPWSQWRSRRRAVNGQPTTAAADNTL